MDKGIKVFLIILILSLSILGGILIFPKKIMEEFPQIQILPAQVSQSLIIPIEKQEIKKLDIKAKSVISIWEFEGKQKILFQKESDKKLPIASLTKLMSAYVILDYYDLNQIIRISKTAAKQPELGKEKFKTGETFKVKDLLHSMLIESSNAATVALTEVIGEKAFVELMNLEAKYLGLKNTKFSNSAGLDVPQNYSTAKDLVKLAIYLLKEQPLIWKISTKPEFNLYSSDGVFHHHVINTNELLGKIPSIVGGKTGETPQAEGCLLLVLKAPKNNGYLINLILGSKNRFEEMEKLIDWINQNYSWKEIRTTDFYPEFMDWEEIKTRSSWPARDSHAVVVFQNKIWLMGGVNGENFKNEKGNILYWKAPHYSDIWYSEDGKNWKKIVDNAPWGKRRSMQVAIFNNKMWLVGGWGPEIGYSNIIWVSENGKDWRKIKPQGGLPPAEGHQLIVFNNKLWLIGGVRYDEGKEKNFVWVSKDGVNWIEIASSTPWAPRWDHAVAVFKNKLWLIGGMDLKGNVYQDIWSSENGKDWILVSKDPSWSPRQGHSAIAFRDKLWVIGGLDGDNSIWYSEDGLSWQKTLIDPQWESREDHICVVFKDKIWIMGGMTSNYIWKNDIWYSIF